jgi:cyclase
MLAKRIIPCLDVKDGRVVKGIKFLELRDAGDPVEQAQVYDREGADELVFLDITASHERRDIVIEMVRRVADSVFIPFTVGGGIRTADDMRALLLAGADKVSINSPAVRTPELITAGATRFGSQCVVVAIDGKWRGDWRNALFRGQDALFRGRNALFRGWEVFIDGGRVPTGLEVVAWAREAERRGAGEILLTSMDTDGTRAGYDLRMLRAVTEAVTIPVIASGGAGAFAHFYDALTVGGADAALAASLFHYRELSVGQVKAYLAGRGVPVRCDA